MKRRMLWMSLSAAFFIAGAALPADGPEAGKHTGWLGCAACSKGRVENKGLGTSAHPGAPNRECTQKCIREGSAVMFYDEATRTLYRVDNPSSTTGQESHRVEVAGTIDAKAGTIHVASVKVLEEYVAKCGVPPAK